MDPSFWHQRWQHNQIGFHEGRVNHHLETYWPQIAPDASQRVLVPLCGKSVDLAWLAGRGHPVVGVELSELACRAFFAERQLEPELESHGPFLAFKAGGVELLCGDFFELTPALMGPVALLYDRASLIALPKELRARYCRHLSTLMPSAARGLLITLDYPDQRFSGPPFAVSDSEVTDHLGQAFALHPLHHGPLHPENPLISRGLEQASESVFGLERLG